MTTLPALQIAIPASAADRAASSLSAQCSSCLKVERNGDDWVLTPSASLTASSLAAGVQAMNQALLGGPTARIAAALMRLIAATRRPAAMDEEREAVYFDTLQEAMHDYPIDVVEDACAQWRKSENGEWWPAEKELRRICDVLSEPSRKLRTKALRLLAELEREEDARDRANQASAFAGGKQRSFMRELQSLMPAAKFDAWFHTCDIAFVGDDLIVTRLDQAAVVNKYAPGLLKKHGIRMERCEITFLNIKPRAYSEPTPAEREEVTRKLNRLKQAMANGENLAKLQADGEI